MVLSPAVVYYEIVSAQEFQEAWLWLIDHISIDQILVEEHGYQLDHKYWQYPDFIKCLDECDNADVFLARLYLISQLSSVSDYLPNLKKRSFTFNLLSKNNQLDGDVARVVNSKETSIHMHPFRNSLSEHLAFWVIVASSIKSAKFMDFLISKPNLQPEDKGPDGLACMVGNGFLEIKIISIKNSINSPRESISSAGFRNSNEPDLNEKKIFDEFYALQNRIRGFERLDDNLNNLLQGLRQNAETQFRWALLDNHSEFNATVIADDQYAANHLFAGFDRIADNPNRRIAIYIGSKNWRVLSGRVQSSVKSILENKGILF